MRTPQKSVFPYITEPNPALSSEAAYNSRRETAVPAGAPVDRDDG
jgi:hypothetical protein